MKTQNLKSTTHQKQERIFKNAILNKKMLQS